MHAFDVAKLGGPEIHVRRARAGEKLKTLDGHDRTLDETMLVIADKDKAVAIAGVMGGADSEVSAGTTRIAVESAWFQPASVRATSKKVGLKTEASIRFERGADLGAPVRALARVRALLQKTGAGRVVGPVSDVFPHPAPARTIGLGRAHLARLLGDTVPDSDVERILTKLGFALTGQPAGLVGGRAVLSRRRHAGGRSHRGCRPPLGIRPDSRDLPRAAHGAPPVVPGRGAGTGRAAAALRRRTPGSRHVHVHRGRLGGGVCARRRPGHADQPAVGEVRDASPVAHARPRGLAGPQPAPGVGDRPALRDRHRLLAHRRRAPAGRLGADRLARPPLERQRGPPRLHRHQGHRDAARDDVQPRHRRRGGTGSAVVRRGPPGAPHARRRPGRLDRAAADDARVGRRATRSTPERSISTRSGPVRRRSSRSRRSRATRRSSEICRLSSQTACQPRTFVARSVATRRRRWSPCASSIGTRVEACRQAR